MLDIKFIRENPDLLRAAIAKKHLTFDLDKFLALDDQRLSQLTKVEAMRAEQNQAGQKLVQDLEPVAKEKLIAEMKEFKTRLQKAEQDLTDLMQGWRQAMLEIPNVPDASVPEGASEADNQEVKTWGDKPKFDFVPKDHIKLMTDLGLVDFERGAKVHGFRGYFLLGEGVKLSFAIWQYALKFFSAKGFLPMLPPTIVRKSNLYGTGHLPGDTEDYYLTQDGDALSGTSEVPIMGYYADEVLPAGALPVKCLGFSPCYRREAGAHGKDVKGLIRVNEFYKFEQVILCEAKHETSVQWHEELNRNTEEFIESLDLPYRTVINCGGDLGLGQVKKYDIELWVPQEKKYREISSTSYFHDFQSRRLGIRYRDVEGKLHFVHSLNATAIPTPRILVSLIENHQQADGSIAVPEVLQPYVGAAVLTRGHEESQKKDA